MKNLFLELKTKLLTLNPMIWIPLLLVLITALFGFSLIRQSRSDPSPTSSPTNVTATPSPKDEPQAPAKFEYPAEKVERLLQIVDNRTPLSPSDLSIRQALITRIGSASGTIHENPRFKIEYVQAADAFMVEVRAIDIFQINRDTIQWLRDQGVSDQGICHFPIVFYPNIPENTLPPTPLIFNPLPEGC